MENREEKIHRTWVQLMVDNNFKDVAAIAIDSGLVISSYDVEDFNEYRRVDSGILIEIPSDIFTYVKKNEQIKK
jgi:hypothetical protein